MKMKKNAIESRLRQAQKMEAVGTLAGGIAHDFNNILTAITGYSELALDDAREGKIEPDDIEQIIAAADRARKLVQQILAFSRKVATAKEPININEIIARTVSILSRTMPKMITLEQSLVPNPELIDGDPAQLEQIIFNLASNAKDAMPDGGKLLIETENVFLDEEYARKHIGTSAGKYVQLTVSDTGVGMDKDHVDKIFDPFFTTKEIGKGTGLGLASVYGIVKHHDGYISCYSEPNVGTAFKIYFPKHHGAHLSEQSDKLVMNNNLVGHETVLLVDDEKDIRAIGSRILRSQGYQVTTAPNGEAAIEIYNSSDQHFDLILLDLSMPGMGGHKALEKFLSINTDAKVLITSGYSLSGQVKDALNKGALGYISKPFRKADMLLNVRKALDRCD